MSFIKAYFWNAVRYNYLNFNGRTKRKEFWYFILITFVITTVLGFLSAILGKYADIAETIFSIIFQLIFLAILLPSLAIGARRLHDANLSGWWQSLYVCIIPVIGLILLIIMFCQPSNEAGARFDK
jgi:uncharacterized membrane protein YhaH (DUF805 family)